MKNPVATSGAEDERRRAKAGGEGGFLEAITEWPREAKTFLGDVRAETRRVTWPSMKQVRATVVVVIVTVFFFGAYFGILDWFYTRLVGWLLRLGG